MTKVPRRRPATPAPSFSSSDPWPSQMEPTPRVTSSGKVNSLPSPIQAMWSEAIGREQDGSPRARHEAEGLCVAISILSCSPLEDVRDELNRRARVPVSATRRRSL